VDGTCCWGRLGGRDAPFSLKFRHCRHDVPPIQIYLTYFDPSSLVDWRAHRAAALGNAAIFAAAWKKEITIEDRAGASELFGGDSQFLVSI